MTTIRANRAAKRPPKPYPDFELFPHVKGYWCKKIDGQHVPFGRWELPDPHGAAPGAYERSWRDAKARYHKHLEDQANGVLLAGRPERLTVEALSDAYLAHHLSRAQGRSAEIKQGTFCELRHNVLAFRDFVGRTSTIGELERFDPTRARESKVMQYIEDLSQRYGWYAYNKRIGAISGMWDWAEDPIRGALGRPFRLRSLFKKREKKLKRREKQRRTEERGKMCWTPEELQAFFTHAWQPLRAQVKLCYFAAYGNSDIADVYDAAFNFEPDSSYGLPKGWAVVHFPRPKTLIERACVLNDDVVKDVIEARAARPRAANKAWANRMFLTCFGNPWVRDAIHDDPTGANPGVPHTKVNIDSFAQEFRKLRDSLSRCDKHGWFCSIDSGPGQGFRSDLKQQRRTQRRAAALSACPVCRKAMTPMRKMPAYTFRHTAVTRASGAADLDSLKLFEGHVIQGMREDYVEELEVDGLCKIARRLMQKVAADPASAPLFNLASASKSG